MHIGVDIVSVVISQRAQRERVGEFFVVIVVVVVVRRSAFFSNRH